MRQIVLATAMLAIPGLAAAQSQLAVIKSVEPLIPLPTPVDVTGRPVPLLSQISPPDPGAAEFLVRPSEQTGNPRLEPPINTARIDTTVLSEAPILRHIADAGATLTNLRSSHGLRTVVSRHGGEFMIFQVVADGQAAVAGLIMDLSVDHLKSMSGSALTELGTQHNLRSFFLRNGKRFQVFYARPDNERVVPGVMWDATARLRRRSA